MPLVATERLGLYAERAGGGEKLLWIGGTGGDLREPPFILETPLARAFDLVVYDQRGLGRSDKPETAATMADYADDAAALLDAIGWERAHVAGYSFGGMVAQHVAIRHNARVARLVLAATSPGGLGGASYPLHELQSLPPDERIRAQLLLDTRLTPERLDAPSRGLSERIEQIRAAEARRAANPAGAAGLARQLEARRGHDAWDGLPNVKQPTLVCAGAFDLLAPPDNARNLARRLPNAKLRFYRGGHGFLVERPDFLEDVVLFLQGEALPAREVSDV